MAGAGSRVAQYLYRRIYQEKQLLSKLRPKEYRRLEEILAANDTCIVLVSGDKHCMDRSELEKLWARIPRYLRGFVKLPFHFIYSRHGTLGVYRLQGPDKWAARIIGYLLRGDIGFEAWEIGRDEMLRLLEDFRSLILISIEAAI